MKQDVCWQYLIKLRRRRQGEGHPRRARPSDAIVKAISLEVAGNFILKYEWLGNMGRSKYCYGLFLTEELVAVACFGPLVSNSHFKRMLGQRFPKRILQLCRGASSPRAPKWAPSKLIGRSLRLVANDTSAWGVVAYADPCAGEIGTIYQATNALYLGMSNPGGSQRYLIRGHWYDPRRVNDKFGSRARAHLRRIDPDFRSVPVLPKHRYFWPIGSRRRNKKLRALVQNMVQPYPKRIGSKNGFGVPKGELPIKLLRHGKNDNTHFASSRPSASTRLGYAARFRPTRLT
jgi:hypothetical protein